MTRFLLIALFLTSSFSLGYASPSDSHRCNLEIRFIAVEFDVLIVTDKKTEKRILLHFDDSNVSSFEMHSSFPYEIRFGQINGSGGRKLIIFKKEEEVLEIIIIRDGLTIEFASDEEFAELVKKEEIQGHLDLVFENFVNEVTE